MKRYKLKNKFTTAKILKIVTDNTNNHLSIVDKTLRENNRRITEILALEKVSLNVLNLLIEIKKNNNSIIVDNTVFKAVEVVIDEDDCN
jgi:glycine/serine hydroxymethyltransferase